MQRQHFVCTFEGCDRSHKARGYCQTHYMQFKRGEPVTAIRAPRVYNRDPICTVEGCSKPEQAMGLCGMHYQRVQRHGSTDYRDRSKSLKPCAFPGCKRPLLSNGYCQRHALRRRKLVEFGLTMEWFIETGNRQNWLCVICDQSETSVFVDSGEIRELAVDHCHEHGHARGLLCNNCNRAIGLLKDDPAILRKAADYLDSHKPLW